MMKKKKKKYGVKYFRFFFFFVGECRKDYVSVAVSILLAKGT